MELLRVEDLCKSYPGFSLKNASFSIEEGYIMGFIGRNGAGKTTALKSMLNLVKKDSGRVFIAGKEFDGNEDYCKKNVGIVFGDVQYYKKKKLKTVTEVTSRFYPEWDGEVYEALAKKFDLDGEKRIGELSAGMRVKYLLALALSHHARLLLLDEPTSGLDPVSRDELLEIFQETVEDGKHSILFSTHITSDLEKCADYITYIRNGEITVADEKDAFLEAYREVRGSEELLTDGLESSLIGLKRGKFGFSGLIRTEELKNAEGLTVSPADLETVMLHFEREEQ